MPTRIWVICRSLEVNPVTRDNENYKRSFADVMRLARSFMVGSKVLFSNEICRNAKSPLDPSKAVEEIS
jgi:uncharacterized membrane protein YdfJ with MMPL/SSD domain